MNGKVCENLLANKLPVHFVLFIPCFAFHAVYFIFFTSCCLFHAFPDGFKGNEKMWEEDDQLADDCKS